MKHLRYVRLPRLMPVGIFLFLGIWMSAMLPVSASAHSALLQAVPAPNSTVQSAPPEIRLTFNERLEKELYWIKVFDDKGEQVTKNETEMSRDQRELRLALPALKDGVYTVSFHIISADGHPVSESYVLTIGKPAFQPEPFLQEQGQGHKHGNLETVYGFRILYYLSFLLLAGWTLWGMWIEFETQEASDHYRKWLSYFRHLNLIFLLETIALQSIDSVDEITFANLLHLWTGTTVGISWIITLALSLAAYAILRRYRWLDGTWVALLLAAKTLNGHAVAKEPPWRTLLLDGGHLLAATVWIGALAFIMIYWNKHREHIFRFLPLFSRASLVSIAVLMLTGTLTALLFLPKLSYVLYTAWGLWLLVKIGLVALVMITGSRIRFYMKNLEGSVSKLTFWLQTDFVLMLAIVSIAGIFTYLSPAPSNEPFNWNAGANDGRRSVQITPNAPGYNQFTVYLTQPQGKPGIKFVQLKLTPKDHPDVAPIDVPLQRVEAGGGQGTDGSSRFMYRAEGPFLAFPGKWIVELTVRDANDDETVSRKEMRLY
jgi:copper transport protein